MPLDSSAEVRAALASGGAVVALETAVLTHGLPAPAGLQALHRQQAAVRATGALPAVVALFAHGLRVGLSDEECARLASRPDSAKVSSWNLGLAQVAPGFGGTTVATTVTAAALTGIQVVSTGGIGGVHAGSGDDVSADLTELSRRPVCVVCAGPKSILDARATLERLETLGVPVIGWRSDLVAGFISETAALPVTGRVDSMAALVSVVRRHWEVGGAGVVISQPLPASLAIPAADLAATIPTQTSAARGAARTPAELAALRDRLGEPAVVANLALLERNATLAGELAVALRR